MFCFVLFFLIITFTFQLISLEVFFPQRSSGQAVVTGVVPFSPPVRAFNFVAHRV